MIELFIVADIYSRAFHQILAAMLEPPLLDSPSLPLSPFLPPSINPFLPLSFLLQRSISPSHRLRRACPFQPISSTLDSLACVLAGIPSREACNIFFEAVRGLPRVRFSAPNLVLGSPCGTTHRRRQAEAENTARWQQHRRRRRLFRGSKFF